MDQNPERDRDPAEERELTEPVTPEPPQTGVASVDGVLRDVHQGVQAPLSEQVETFEQAHRRLRAALDDSDAVDPATTGPGGPASA